MWDTKAVCPFKQKKTPRSTCFKQPCLFYEPKGLQSYCLSEGCGVGISKGFFFLWLEMIPVFSKHVDPGRKGLQDTGNTVSSNLRPLTGFPFRVPYYKWNSFKDLALRLTHPVPLHKTCREGEGSQAWPRSQKSKSWAKTGKSLLCDNKQLRSTSPVYKPRTDMFMSCHKQQTSFLSPITNHSSCEVRKIRTLWRTK